MASAEAPAHEIAAAVSTMHEAIVDAWHKEETPYSSLTTARTAVEWNLDIGRGCSVGVKEAYGNEYRRLDAPLGDYGQRDKATALPLNVSLPKERTGAFELVVSKHDIELNDKHPHDPETLSYAGLLKLLDVSAPEDVYAYLQNAATTGRATKKLVHREVVAAEPPGDIWPLLYAAETAVEGKVVTQEVALSKRKSQGNAPSLWFSGLNMILDNDPLLCSYDCEVQGEKVHVLTSGAVRKLGQLATVTLDLVYGHACYRYDVAWPRQVVLRKEILGLNGKPNEYAQFGYAFSRKTRPLAL